MKPLKDLSEINKALLPQPQLQDRFETSGEEIHEVKEDRLLSQINKLKENGVSLPLAYFFSKKGLYVRFYFSYANRDFSFFVPTTDQKHVLKRLQEELTYVG